MGSKGSQTSTSQTTTSAQPEAMELYRKLLQQAQGVAATPYTPYAGELVAPVNAQQATGIAGINAAANYAQPWMTTALGYADRAAQPITQEQIQQYMSPYTKNVVDATQAQFNNQNAQQQQKLLGNAIGQGALGGNRVAIGQAALAGQQQLAQAPVIAGLQNQGYQTGLNTALSQQQAMALGANSLGTLGIAGQNAALGGAGAQIGAGTLQQQNQQQINDAAYQQFMQQQGYPFQTLQWLAGLGTGVGSQMGGTSSGTTTQPGPSAASGILGGITGIGGMLGQSGAFGSAGWMAPLLMSDERVKENIERVGKLNDGQAIYRFNYKGDPTTHVGLLAQEVEDNKPEAVGVMGGGIKGVDYAKATEDAVERAFGGAVRGYDVGGGVAPAPVMPYAPPAWVPSIGLAPGNTLPRTEAPKPAQQQGGDIAKQLSEIGKLAKGLYDSFEDTPAGVDAPLPGSAPLGQGGIGSRAGGGGVTDNAAGLGWVPSFGIAQGNTMPRASAPEFKPQKSEDFTKGLSALGGLGKDMFDTFQTATWDGGTPLEGSLPIGKGGIGRAARGGAMGVAGYADGGGPTFDERFRGEELGEGRDHGLIEGSLGESGLLFDNKPLAPENSFIPPKGVVAPPTPPTPPPPVPEAGVAPELENVEPAVGLDAPVPLPKERPVMGLEPVAPERKITRATPTGDYAPGMERIAAAHRSIESSNNYGALGPRHPKTGDRAYGAYQVMGANVPVWTKEILGKAMTPDEFLASKEAQDAVYKAKMGSYVNKYGVEGALRAWLGPASKDFKGTTQEAYRDKFMTALGKSGDTPPAATGVAAADTAELPPKAQLTQAEKPGFDWSEKNKLWPALTAAGFAMMASRSPHLANAIGEGGLAGTQTFENLKNTEAAQRMGKARIDLEARKLSQQADRWTKEDARKDREFSELSAKDKALMELRSKPFTELSAADRAKLAVEQAKLEEARRANDMKLREPVKVGQDPVRGTDIYAVPRVNPNGGIDYHKIDPKSGRIDPTPMNDTNNPLKQSGSGPFRPGIAPQGGVQNAGFQTAEARLEKAAASAPPPEVRATFPAGSKQARNEEYLSELAKEDPRYAAAIKAIANYQISPAQFSLRNNRKERAMGDVMMYDPTYDQREYNKRNTAVTRFSTGKQGDAVRSFGVSLEHLQTADELGKAIKNGDVQAINKMTNYVKTQLGAEAVPNFNAAKQIVAGEINKMIVGGTGTGGEREELQHQFNAASSPEQLAGVIETLKKLMVGQVKGLKQQYETSTGLRNFEEMLPPTARSELERLGSHGAPAGGGAPTKVDPKDEAFLKSNPKAKAAIDKKYGAGTADRILGVQ